MPINNKKIIVLFNTMIEHPSGGDSRIIELCKRFRRSFSVRVILSEDSADYFIKEGLSPLIYAKTARFKKIYGYPLGMALAYFLRLWQAIFYLPKFRKGIIFYAPSDLLIDAIPAVLGKFLNSNSNFVQVIHHLVPHWRKRGRGAVNNILSYMMQNISLLIIRFFADLIFVVDPQVKDELIKRGFKNKIEVAGNGIDLEGIEKIYSTIKTAKKFEGVFLGRLQYSKGAMDLPEIWRLLVEKKRKAKLVIIGNALPEVMARMKKKITEYGLVKNIVFLGYVTRRDLIKTLKESAIFVYPSHEEGWGIVVAEAMACRLPVVAYNLPVFKRLFPEGMVSHNIGEYADFARSITELLDKETKYNKLSKKAYLISQNYSWEKVAKKEAVLLRQLGENEKK